MSKDDKRLLGTMAEGATNVTNTNQLTNGANFITASTEDTLTNKQGSNSQWTNDAGYITDVTGDIFADLSDVAAPNLSADATDNGKKLVVNVTNTAGEGLDPVYEAAYTWAASDTYKDADAVKKSMIDFGQGDLQVNSGDIPQHTGIVPAAGTGNAYATHANLKALWGPTSGDGTEGDPHVFTMSTDDIQNEGTTSTSNLWYTETRVDNRIDFKSKETATASTIAKWNANKNLDTDGLLLGDNGIIANATKDVKISADANKNVVITFGNASKQITLSAEGIENTSIDFTPDGEALQEAATMELKNFTTDGGTLSAPQ